MSQRPAVSTPGGSAELAGRAVARIGFGTMQVGEGGGHPADAVALLHRARELGVDLFDTAQFYGEARANELLRTALASHDDRNDVVLMTKVGADRRGDDLVAAQRPEELRRQIEQNLASLGVERLDVVNLRRVDRPPGIIAEGDQVVDLDSQLAELSALRDDGLVGGIGLSAVSAEQVVAALPAGIVCVQNAGSLLDRTSEAAHDVCRAHGVAWVPFFPLGSAFAQVPSVADHPDVVATAARLGHTPAQVGLAWLLDDDPRTLLIPGTTSTAHLEQNVAAGSVVLDDEARELLRRVAAAPDPDTG